MSTTSARFGITRWASGSDSFTRSQMDDSHRLIDEKAAGFIQGDGPPSGSLLPANYEGFFYYSSTTSSDGSLFYCNGDSWKAITEPAATINSVGTVATVGSSLQYARADHVHVLGVDSVNTASIQGGAVTTAKIGSLQVTTDKIGNLQVTTDKIGDLQVTTDKIGDLQVTTGKIGDLQVTTEKIALGAVVESKIALGAVVESKIGTGAVTTGKIGDLQVTNAKLASGIDASKITTGTLPSGRISGSYTALTGTGVLAEGSITTTFGNINIGTSTFTGNGSGLNTLNASELDSGTVPSARISGSYTGFTTITASSTITGAKYVAGTAGSAAAPEYTWSGDTNTGMFWDADDSIGFATGGVERMQIGSTYAVFDAGTTGAAAIPTAAAGNSVFPAFTFAGDTNTGMYRADTDQVGITAGGTPAATFASGTIFTGIPTATTSGMQAVYRETTFGGLYYFTSVRENKEQITYIDWDVGQIIDSLKPVTFIPKFLPRPDHPAETPEEEALRLADLNYGFVAEDVALVADGKIASWKWENDELVPAMWKQTDVIAILVAEVKALRQRIAAVEV